MQTVLHGDVIARMLTSDELEQEFGQAGDVVLSGYRTARGRMADEDGAHGAGSCSGRAISLTVPTPMCTGTCCTRCSWTGSFR